MSEQIIRLSDSAAERIKQKEKEISILQNTIKWFKKQIEPHDCGWMYTTIDGLKHRISVLRKEIRKLRKK